MENPWNICGVDSFSKYISMGKENMYRKGKTVERVVKIPFGKKVKGYACPPKIVSSIQKTSITPFVSVSQKAAKLTTTQKPKTTKIAKTIASKIKTNLSKDIEKMK